MPRVQARILPQALRAQSSLVRALSVNTASLEIRSPLARVYRLRRPAEASTRLRAIRRIPADAGSMKHCPRCEKRKPPAEFHGRLWCDSCRDAEARKRDRMRAEFRSQSELFKAFQRVKMP